MTRIEFAKLWFQNYKSVLPSYLGYFNIANMKRRNMYLGHLIGDKDIDSLLRDANKFGDDRCKALRIGGDEIINFFGSETSIFELNTAYSKIEDIMDSYRIESTLNGKRLEKCESRKTKIYRYLHCVFKELTSENYFESVLNNMIDVAWLCTPGEPKRLDDIRKFISLPDPISFHKLSDLSKEDQEKVRNNIDTRWNCIEKPLERSCICLFCGGELFDWRDDGDGICKNCGAKCSFDFGDV